MKVRMLHKLADRAEGCYRCQCVCSGQSRPASQGGRNAHASEEVQKLVNSHSLPKLRASERARLGDAASTAREVARGAREGKVAFTVFAAYSQWLEVI